MLTQFVSSLLSLDHLSDDAGDFFSVGSRRLVSFHCAKAKQKKDTRSFFFVFIGLVWWRLCRQTNRLSLFVNGENRDTSINVIGIIWNVKEQQRSQPVLWRVYRPRERWDVSIIACFYFCFGRWSVERRICSTENTKEPWRNIILSLLLIASCHGRPRWTKPRRRTLSVISIPTTRSLFLLDR